MQARTHAMARNLHVAGLEAGGSDGGAPGFQDADSDRFHGGYLRDPLGNTIAIFTANPAEGIRGR